MTLRRTQALAAIQVREESPVVEFLLVLEDVRTVPDLKVLRHSVHNLMVELRLRRLPRWCWPYQSLVLAAPISP